MFGDAQPQRRQLVDLTMLAQHCGRIRRQRPVTAPADGRPVLDHYIGRCHQPQRLAPVSQLPARLLPTPAPQALRLARQPIAGGRLGAIVAVLGQPRFQLVHPRVQHSVLCQHRLQLLALLAHEALEFRDPLLCRHATMLLCYYATPAPQVRLNCHAFVL